MQTKQKQQGILVLAVSLALLLIMGIFALMLELRGVKQVKIAAQTYQGEQANAAAEAGLNYGVAYVIETPTGAISPASTTLNVATINSQLGSGGGQVSSITSSEQSTNVYKIIAVGQSADGLMSKTIEHVIHIDPQNPDNSGYEITGWKDY